MDPRELEPLEACRIPRRPALRQHSHLTGGGCHRTPLRVCRMITLLILLPTLFITVPLYMRYRVFSSQMYPMGMTDMRLIDGRVSPTWCQNQVVKSNATFNAFVVPGAPEIARELVPVTMTRQMVLKADMKEYWGFYLLQGSSVTVSPCVRRPGASLVMIKGYKHLQNCAYIGDDSSEEVDELIEAEKLGLLDHNTLIQKLSELKKEDGKANQPGTMRRHKAGVSFHDPSNAENATSSDPVPSLDVTDHDPKELREILEHLHAIRQAIKDKATKEFRLPDHLVSVAALHRFRDTNVDRDEQKWLTFRDLDNTSDNKTKSDIETSNNGTRLADSSNEMKNKFTTTTEEITTKLLEHLENEINTIPNKTDISVEVDHDILNATFQPNTNKDTNDNDLITIEEETLGAEKVDETEPDSREIFEDVLKRLQALGEKGKRVLKKLKESMGIDDLDKNNLVDEDIMSKVTGSSEELDRLRHVLVSAIDEERARTSKNKTVDKVGSRSKRQLVLGSQNQFQKTLNEDDEARDYAAEEDLEPDGYAEHHTKVNETSPFDMSNSEFWSSFSSSEEALLECEGLILNLPLTPHPRCEAAATEDEKILAAQRNALTYRVPANGYYFFVFNSENEVQENLVSVRFDLQKTRYDVARTALRECRSQRDQCSLKLDMFTAQRVVLELPYRNNDSLWNEQFVVVSECEPRTSVYLACALTVPVLILMFAFQ